MMTFLLCWSWNIGIPSKGFLSKSFFLSTTLMFVLLGSAEMTKYSKRTLYCLAVDHKSICFYGSWLLQNAIFKMRCLRYLMVESVNFHNVCTVRLKWKRKAKEILWSLWNSVFTWCFGIPLLLWTIKNALVQFRLFFIVLKCFHSVNVWQSSGEKNWQSREVFDWNALWYS